MLNPLEKSYFSHKNNGFTLLEVLVALVILAISLTAISYAISRNAQNAAYLDQKTAAHWVAMNIISQQQVKAKLPNFPTALQDQGTTEMLNHTWFWQSKIETMDTNMTYRIHVEVSATANGPPVETLESYIYHDQLNHA